MTIWRMRFVCWIPKATNTHSKYLILIVVALQQWLYERTSMLRHTYSTFPPSPFGNSSSSRLVFVIQKQCFLCALGTPCINVTWVGCWNSTHGREYLRICQLFLFVGLLACDTLHVLKSQKTAIWYPIKSTHTPPIYVRSISILSSSLSADLAGRVFS